MNRVLTISLLQMRSNTAGDVIRMILNDRKIKILEAIITDYIQTAEPIGSRTIAKKYDLGVSSATIRNEMSDLEEMGFIIQPHASSGRVPSDRGYRFYVDRMMGHRELTKEEESFLYDMACNNITQIDYLMQETAKAIALLTNYTTIASEPKIKKTKVKYVQLMPLDEVSIVMLLVTDSKAVRNQVINLRSAPSHEVLGEISVLLSNYLHGCSLENISMDMASLLSETAIDEDIFMPVLSAIVETIEAEDNVQIFTSGVKNILAFPEFNDLEKAKSIFQALEEKKVLITLLDNDSQESIKVVIGEENSLAQMKDCSIISAHYSLFDQSMGSIGIIGPTRMNYPQVISILSSISKYVNTVLQTLKKKGDRHG